MSAGRKRRRCYFFVVDLTNLHGSGVFRFLVVSLAMPFVATRAHDNF